MSMSSAQSPALLTTAPSPATTARFRLDYVDGLRALAALYVVLYHTYTEINYRLVWGIGPSLLPRRIVALSHVISWGHLSVAVFIVLSGFCLMLPVARSAAGELKGGARQFFMRRARRILPPYYIALLFSLLICQLPFIAHPHNIKAEIAAPFTWPSVLTHLLLIHNLVSNHGGMINGPMWSIGLECQIYVFFPFLLLPLWRRYGNAAPVMTAFAIGFAPHFLARGWMDGTYPWYLGLFSLGMIAAVIAYAPHERYENLRSRIPWQWAFLVPGFVFLTLPFLKSGWFKEHAYLTDPLLGVTVSCLLIWAAGIQKRRSRVPLLETPALVWLGTFSYSLYLIHAPLQSIAHWLLNQGGIRPLSAYAILLFVVDPLIIGLAYLFHLRFERPFMPGSPKSERQAEITAALSPAP